MAMPSEGAAMRAIRLNFGKFGQRGQGTVEYLLFTVLIIAALTAMVPGITARVTAVAQTFLNWM